MSCPVGGTRTSELGPRRRPSQTGGPSVRALSFRRRLHGYLDQRVPGLLPARGSGKRRFHAVREMYASDGSVSTKLGTDSAGADLLGSHLGAVSARPRPDRKGSGLFGPRPPGGRKEVPLPRRDVLNSSGTLHEIHPVRIMRTRSLKPKMGCLFDYLHTCLFYYEKLKKTNNNRKRQYPEPENICMLMYYMCIYIYIYIHTHYVHKS